MTKKFKSYTTAEAVILPTYCKIVNIMFGEEYEKRDVENIPMSDNTISRRIQDMSQDVESQAIADIKELIFFSIQLDMSTDVTGKAQLLAFSSIVCTGDIAQQFLFWKRTPRNNKRPRRS
jgi:hypothetical protein